ncbi:MAG: hypothetical protein ACOYD6_03285 [Limnochordia bacterium]|jgi:hypothetical protein
MPNEEQMNAVGEACSHYDAVVDEDRRSCANCSHWAGESAKCELDIFDIQLTNLDQT